MSNKTKTTTVILPEASPSVRPVTWSDIPVGSYFTWSGHGITTERAGIYLKMSHDKKVGNAINISESQQGSFLCTNYNDIRFWLITSLKLEAVATDEILC